MSDGMMGPGHASLDGGQPVLLAPRHCGDHPAGGLGGGGKQGERAREESLLEILKKRYAREEISKGNTRRSVMGKIGCFGWQ